MPPVRCRLRPVALAAFLSLQAWAATAQQAEQLIILHQPKVQQYEFESLYGIGTDQLAALKQRGHPAKMYFVYGQQWYLYLCNRIAEHPLNLFTALNDIVNG